MSYTAGELVACPTLQTRLDDMFNTCNPLAIREPMPLFEFLMSPVNQKGLEQALVPGSDGKIRTVQVKYKSRLQESAVASNQSNPNCTASTFRTDKYTNYTVDTTANEQIEGKFDINDLINSCESNENYMAEEIMRMMDALVRKVATKTTTQAVALYGKYADNVVGVSGDFLEVATLRTGTTDQPNAFALQKIRRAVEKTNYCAPYVVFSGETLQNYMELMKNGCCAEYGLDLGGILSQYNFASVYDMRIEDAMDTAQALMVQTGALQLIRWNLFRGARGINEVITENYKQTVLFDRTGLPIDAVFKLDCGVMHIILTATTVVKGMPNDMFDASDRLTGVNFVNRIKVVNS